VGIDNVGINGGVWETIYLEGTNILELGEYNIESRHFYDTVISII
jgi:hypothetical protein